MKKIVLAALIVPALLIVSCKTTHPAGVYEKAQDPNQGSIPRSAVVAQQQAPQATPAPQTSTSSTTQDVRTESYTLAATETNQDPINKKYNVVVGSFASQLNAQNLSATLKSEGRNPAVVVNENNMYRVIIASYDDYAQATRVKEELQSRFAGAWLLVQAK